MLRDFEKVSIVSTTSSEWWILRKTPDLYETSQISAKNNGNDCDKIGASPAEDVPDNSFSSKNTDPNCSNRRRTSDASTSKFLPKRFSNDFDTRSVANFKLQPLVCKSLYNFMEEELYIKGNIVIWSKGLSYNKDEDSTRETVCTYSSTYPVKHALWCTFYCERPIIENPLVAPELKPDEPTADPISCVAIIDGQNLKVFTVDNEDFLTALPFNVKSVWNIKFGVLLERDISGKYDYFV